MACMDFAQALPKFQELTEKMSHLGSVLGLLDADMEISMPKAGGERRGEVVSTVTGILHDLETSPEYAEVLDTLLRHPEELQPEWLKAVQDAKLEYERALLLPKDFVMAQAKAQTECYLAWEQAREASHFPTFLEPFREVVKFARDSVQLIDPHSLPYDVLLDDYEEGLTWDLVSKTVLALQQPLGDLLMRCRESLPQPKLSLPVARQREINADLLVRLGLDVSGARLSESAHPFSSQIHAGDIRLTTRYFADDALDTILSTVHETGHALYEQGLPAGYEHISVGQAPSLAMHESQSRIYENMIGHSLGFIEWLFRQYGISGTPAQYWVAVNAVRRPSLIRVSSDELTYPLHIIMRTQLEKSLIEGNLQPQDLPGAWNEASLKLLGEVPPDDARGCLQDSHWSVGMFGYFPCYTLGDIRSAQLYAAALKDLPTLETQFAQGSFTILRDWLGEKVHRRGSMDDSVETLMNSAVGKGTDSTEYLAHLNRRFSELYSL